MVKAFRRTTTRRSSGSIWPLTRETRRLQYSLGDMYDEGRGVPKDDKEALKWYRLAANKGFAAAQYNLGSMYHDWPRRSEGRQGGDQVVSRRSRPGRRRGQQILPLLYKDSLEWLRSRGWTRTWRWRRTGSAWSMRRGWAFRRTSRKPPSGGSWLPTRETRRRRRAWDFCMSLGNGAITQDYVQAYLWYSLVIAVSSGKCQRGVGRQAVMRKLTPAQLTEAQESGAELEAEVITCATWRFISPRGRAQLPAG